MDNSDFHFPLFIAEKSSLALCFDNAIGRPGELKPRPVTTTSSSVVLAGLGGLSDALAGLGGSTVGLGRSADWFVGLFSTGSASVSVA